MYMYNAMYIFHPSRNVHIIIHSLCGLQTNSQGILVFATFPNSSVSSEHIHAPSSSTVAGWGLAGWAGHTRAD